MIAFSVPDMSCDHCAQTIEQAVRGLDKGAKVDVDLQRKVVRVDSAAADAESLRRAIVSAGFTPSGTAS